MKRLGLVTSVGLLGILVALPVAADAPITGDDRQYEDFVGSDTTITDRKTKLVWQRSASELMTFTAAQAFCKGAFRLPSAKELLSIVDEDPHQQYDGTQLRLRYIDKPAFPTTPVDRGFWTSSEVDANRVWTVEFSSGLMDEANKGDSRYVRCVRALP